MPHQNPPPRRSERHPSSFEEGSLYAVRPYARKMLAYYLLLLQSRGSEERDLRYAHCSLPTCL